MQVNRQDNYFGLSMRCISSRNVHKNDLCVVKAKVNIKFPFRLLASFNFHLLVFVTGAFFFASWPGWMYLIFKATLFEDVNVNVMLVVYYVCQHKFS
jgi:hypothetical protein